MLDAPHVSRESWLSTFRLSQRMVSYPQLQVLLILWGKKWVSEGLKESSKDLQGPCVCVGPAETIHTRGHRQPLQEMRCQQGWAVFEGLHRV